MSEQSQENMRRGILVVQAQRNRALDECAEATIRIIALSDEVEQLKAKIEELKKGSSD